MHVCKLMYLWKIWILIKVLKSGNNAPKISKQMENAINYIWVHILPPPSPIATLKIIYQCKGHVTEQIKTITWRVHCSVLVYVLTCRLTRRDLRQYAVASYSVFLVTKHTAKPPSSVLRTLQPLVWSAVLKYNELICNIPRHQEA